MTDAAPHEAELVGPPPAESDTDSFCTPPDLLQLLATFGPTYLDPCSNRHSNVKAVKRYALEDGEDGLQADWCVPSTAEENSFVFVNPPYSNPLPWVERACMTSNLYDGFQTHIIMLVNLDHTTRWSTMAMVSADSMCLLSKRVRFWKDGKPAPARNSKPSVLYYWGGKPGRFASRMLDANLGPIINPRKVIWNVEKLYDAA